MPISFRLSLVVGCLPFDFLAFDPNLKSIEFFALVLLGQEYRQQDDGRSHEILPYLAGMNSWSSMMLWTIVPNFISPLIMPIPFTR